MQLNVDTLRYNLLIAISTSNTSHTKITEMKTGKLMKGSIQFHYKAILWATCAAGTVALLNLL